MGNGGGNREKIANFHFDFIAFYLRNVHVPRNCSLKNQWNLLVAENIENPEMMPKFKPKYTDFEP